MVKFEDDKDYNNKEAEEQHVHRVEELMPSFFVFSSNEKGIRFNYNGSAVRSNAKATYQAQTFTKMVSGLNHFLAYWFNTDVEVYHKVCLLISASLFESLRQYQDYVKTKMTLDIKIESLRKCTVISDELLNYIIQYVDQCTDNTIDESASTTTIMITNRDARFLNVLSVVVKLDFLLTGLVRGSDTTFDKVMVYIADNIIHSTVERFKKFYGTEDVDIHSIIDRFIYNKISKVFDNSAKSSYKIKFGEFGMDAVKITDSRRITFLAAFRSYHVKLKDMETAAKYSEDKNSISDIQSKMDTFTYVNGFTSYIDFRFNNLNMAGFMSSTLEKIVTKQELSTDLPDINRSEFLTDNNDLTNANRREESYFENKNKHLYITRQSNMILLNEEFVEELTRILETKDNPEELISLMKTVPIDRKHNLNTFILHKILLSLTGESKIFIKTMGRFTRVILFVFWLKIRELEEFYDIANAMMKKPTDIPTSTEEELQIALDNNNLVDRKYTKMKSLLVVYTDGRSQVILSQDNLCKFIKEMDKAIELVRMLFPHKVSITNIINTSEQKFRSSLQRSEEKYRNAAISYLQNKVVPI